MATRQTYDGNGNIVFVETIPDTPVFLMPIDLAGLFTPAELLALEQSTNLAVVAFRTQFFFSLNPIALDDPRFVAAVGIMQTLGILTEARAASVLAGTK